MVCLPPPCPLTLPHLSCAVTSGGGAGHCRLRLPVLPVIWHDRVLRQDQVRCDAALGIGQPGVVARSCAAGLGDTAAGDWTACMLASSLA